MSADEIIHEGTISKAFRRKELFKTGVILCLKDAVIILTFSVILLISTHIATTSVIQGDIVEAIETRDNALKLLPFITTFGIIAVDVVVLLLNFIYKTLYMNNFTYVLTKSNLIIDHGILEKNHIVIPFNRIQNISIVQGLFDRLFKTHNFNLETAGRGGKFSRIYTQAGPIPIKYRPEGYIPGIENPVKLRTFIKRNMKYHSHISSGVEYKVLKPEEVAFDNFISLVLQKFEDANLFTFKLKEMMMERNVSDEDMAKMVGVSVTFIQELKNGYFAPSMALANRIAVILNCNIEEIFKLK